MITLNTDSTFTQVKFVNNMNICIAKHVTVAEAIKMTSSAVTSMKREGKVVKVVKRMGELDDLLLNAMDETLRRVFREEGAKVIYVFMENKCHLKREKIAEKTEDFSAGLERLLGSAAPMIEKMILENLYSKLRLKFVEKEGYGFSDYVKELKGRNAYVKG